MKKHLVVLGLVLALSTSALVYAQSDTDKVETLRQDCPYYNELPEELKVQREEAFKERMASKRSLIEKDLKEGTITKEEAEKWLAHFDSMEKWHNENGFYPGSCQGGYGKGLRRGNGRGFRYSR
jgi:hypothetical protein